MQVETCRSFGEKSRVPAISCRWIFPKPADSKAVGELRLATGCARFAAELLVARGFGAPPSAESYLQPRLKSLSDPSLLPAMPAAVDRLLAAIDRKERIALYGDYDVDGVTSLALLSRILRAYGAEPACFLPSRVDEGYGMSPDGVARCVSEHAPQLVVAVDCGTSSVAEIARLAAEGIDVVVLDHHECKTALPVCTALVNPKLGDDFHYLCSVGIVFKLVHALLKRRPIEGVDLRHYLDLVALGTVADLVPLREENRVLVKRGLAQLEQTRWVGLQELIDVSGLRTPLSPANIGFGLGPRLNAAGRLGTAQDALELLLTEDRGRARMLAANLDVEITLGEIDYELLDQHEALQPFGMANPQPLFCARGVTLVAEPRVMKEKHLSLLLRQGGDEYRAVWFGAASQTLPRLPWDIAFHIERNEWQGSVSPQIQIRAVRKAE